MKIQMGVRTRQHVHLAKGCSKKKKARRTLAHEQLLLDVPSASTSGLPGSYMSSVVAIHQQSVSNQPLLSSNDG
jgi:hypothetical protein